MKENKRNIGRYGEDKAAQFLAEKGMKILSRNYRAGRTAEIDLICEHNDTIIFFEVKTRYSGRFGGPLYSISPKKIESIKYCAKHFIHRSLNRDISALTFRFDLISIEDEKITWLEDIFR